MRCAHNEMKSSRARLTAEGGELATVPAEHDGAESGVGGVERDAAGDEAEDRRQAGLDLHGPGKADMRCLTCTVLWAGWINNLCQQRCSDTTRDTQCLTVEIRT